MFSKQGLDGQTSGNETNTMPTVYLSKRTVSIHITQIHKIGSRQVLAFDIDGQTLKRIRIERIWRVFKWNRRLVLIKD